MQMDIIFSTLHPADKNMKCQPGWNSACAEASVRLFQWLHYKKKKETFVCFCNVFHVWKPNQACQSFKLARWAISAIVAFHLARFHTWCSAPLVNAVNEWMPDIAMGCFPTHPQMQRRGKRTLFYFIVFLTPLFIQRGKHEPQQNFKTLAWTASDLLVTGVLWFHWVRKLERRKGERQLEIICRLWLILFCRSLETMELSKFQWIVTPTSFSLPFCTD